MNPYESIAAAVHAAYPELDAGDIQPTAPPNLAMGDVALPMFLAARKLKAPPPKLAAEAAEKVAFGPEVRSASAAGPYLNLKLERAVFARAIVGEVLAQGHWRVILSGSGIVI